MPEQGRQFELKQLEEQANAAKAVSEKLESLNSHIEKLNNTISEASKSSGRLSSALNWLTFALVVIGLLAVCVEVFVK